MLDELQQRAAGKFGKVIITDREGDLPTVVFDEQVGFGEGYDWQLLDADFRHTKTWQEVHTLIDDDIHEPVFVLGSGDDSANIRTALWLSQKHPRAVILARCFRHSTFADQISDHHDFEVVSTSDLLIAGMHPEWFGEAQPH